MSELKVGESIKITENDLKVFENCDERYKDLMMTVQDLSKQAHTTQKEKWDYISEVYQETDLFNLQIDKKSMKIIIIGKKDI